MGEKTLSILSSFFSQISRWLSNDPQRSYKETLSLDDKTFLEQKVSFYKGLTVEQKQQFEERLLLFLETTKIFGNQLDVSQHDRLLVASSAIIPVWKFPQWHYFNLQEVILVPGTFNEHAEFGQMDSRIQGMVGTGPLSGKMILSQPALHHGFSNDKDKQNVAIHEFAHLIDMADGDCDGFPERLKEYSFCLPWLNLVRKKIGEIHEGDSNIRDYGATNPTEFFAVCTEYFFERPGMLKANTQKYMMH